MDKKPEALIFGAGALALGFLGPELDKDWALTFIDIDTKKELLSHLKNDRRYSINIIGPLQKTFEVTDVDGLNLSSPKDRKEIVRKFSSSKLIFTSVGTSNLSSLVPIFCEGLNFRQDKNIGDIYILCCENGRDIATKFQNSIESTLNMPLPPELKILDTVMGRMCRVEPDISGDKATRPVHENANWAIVAESFFGFPIKKSQIREENFFSSPFQLKEDSAFNALEDIKFFAHNGCHAFLGYLGSLKRYKYFGELKADSDLMGLAYEMLFNEVGEALVKAHRTIDRKDYENYAIDLMRRLTCPYFNDSIDRATRKPLEKLSHDERLILGANFILSQGIQPKIYSLAIGAAIHLCIDNKEWPSGDLDKMILTHCKLTSQRDSELIRLIKDSYEKIKNSNGDLQVSKMEV